MNIDKYYLTLVHHLGDPTLSVIDFMATDITSTTITLSWSPPALVPVSYKINHNCRIFCESFGSEENGTSVTSTYNLTDITPYTECDFSLVGMYGAQNVTLTSIYTNTTLFAGKVFFL